MAKEAHELSRINSICPNPEEQLLHLVKNNEIGSIRKFCAQNTNILKHIYDYPYHKPILYIACDDFANEVEPSTIETLINLGADLYYCDGKNGYREAIHYSVSGNNPYILKLIVEKITEKEKDKEKINAKANGLTAISILVRSESVTTANFEKCLDILLEANVNVNITDNKGYTPILWAAHKSYKNVVTAILDSTTDVDIDTHKMSVGKNKGKSARDLIEEKHLYDKPLPTKYIDSNENSINESIQLIKNLRTEEFLALENINVNDEIDEGTLLQLASERNLFSVVKRLLDEKADVYKKAAKNSKYPLEIAAERGYHKVFKLLLPKYTTLPKDILILLLKNVGSSYSDSINYQDCVKILLDANKDLNVNTYSDTGNTPLHYASICTDPNVAPKLLQRGASLANANDWGYLPIEDIDPSTLEEHFDNCVTANEQPRSDKQSIVVTFDFKTLVPTNDNKQTDIESNRSLISHKQLSPVSETGVVYAMSRIPEMHHLLIHPLISSFLYIKWYRMRWFYRINLILFSLFCTSLIFYVFLPNDDGTEQEYKVPISLVQFVLRGTYIILILRELFQMIFAIRTYWCSLSNLLEVVMLCICSYVIFFKSSELLYRQLSSIAMILIALDMMVLLGQHPKLSTNIVMLRTVAKNFFSFLLWYSILIVAFALCFYNLFNKASEKNKHSNSTTVQNNKDDAEQDFFVEPGLTFIKIIVMLTGEFDASSIDFETFANRLIFLAFVFMIPIILFNLLNGLAVSDTQMIKNDAEIVGLIERIKYIVYVENVILGNVFSKNLLCLFQQCFACCETNTSKKYNLVPKTLVEQISLFPHYLSDEKLEIMLYHGGKIISKQVRKGCFNLCKDININKKTVKRVTHLLTKKNIKNKEIQYIEYLEETVKFQRDTIDNLLKVQKELTVSMENRRII